ncbi:hypothetical protein DH86_00001926 [Scytalidium sp. 3C]|nr:hypothetical protein DH86_00001926 [Scytalidium sp. 3C]
MCCEIAMVARRTEPSPDPERGRRRCPYPPCMGLGFAGTTVQRCPSLLGRRFGSREALRSCGIPRIEQPQKMPGS